MTPERWERIQSLFFAACDLDPAARAAFLADAYVGDPSVRREVEELLRAEQRSGATWESSISDTIAAAASDLVDVAARNSNGGHMHPRIHVLVFDGFADWEPSYALAELRRSGHHEIVSVGFTRDEVTSMGGLRVRPDRTLADVRADEVRLLIIPGGELWEREDGYPRAEVEALVATLLAAQRPVAAICGGTVAMARGGFLDDRRHTSNTVSYLRQHVPSYRGEEFYDTSLAVRDRGMITASGLGAVDFAREIFAELGVFSESDEMLWYDMFKYGKMPAGVG
jgi:putative intracellular protease/amidase